MVSFRVLWLAVYNAIQAIGWAFILHYLCIFGLSNAFASLSLLVFSLQALVLFDVVHALCGFWPDEPLVALWQRLWCKVGHRSEIFISILLFADDAKRNSVAFGAMLALWAFADVSRFVLYFLRTLDWPVPNWLRWVRYSDFIPQYPAIVVAEAWFVGSLYLTNDDLMFWLQSCFFVMVLSFFFPTRWAQDTRISFAATGLFGAILLQMLRVDTKSYAPVALFFQIWEWVIFGPGYWVLWNVRKRRLSSQHGAPAPDIRCDMLEDIIIRAAGDEADATVAGHWRRVWLETVAPKDGLCDDLDERTFAFLVRARKLLQYQTFIAFDRKTQEIVGSVSCQVWEGPMPLAAKPEYQRFGSVWAVYVRPSHRKRGLATAMMKRVKEHWRKCGCREGLLIYASDNGRRVYERLGFKGGKILLIDAHEVNDAAIRKLVDVSVVDASGTEDEQFVVENSLRAWRELGILDHQVLPDAAKVTEDFLRQAKQCKSFVARTASGRIVGSVVANAWSGPLPLVLKENVFKLGTLWGLFVEPEFRHRGIAQALVCRCMQHWFRELQCTRGIVLLPDEALRPLFVRAGFSNSNGMSIDLIDDETQRMAQVLKDAGVSGDEKRLFWLAMALPQQLKAVCGESEYGTVTAMQRRFGRFIDPADNAFSRNLHKMGGNFDYEALRSDADRVRAKFDKLAERYDVWSVGNRSRVEEWVTQQGSNSAHVKDFARNGAVLDVACGIGLMGLQLRLCGFQGKFTGVDISRGMLQAARTRRVYDELVLANANERIPLADGTFNIVMCTGALEILEHQERICADFCRLLKPNGLLLATFQANDGNATDHQNIVGISRNRVSEVLASSGFDELDVQLWEDAFFTPKDGKLIPVPYFFVVAKKR